MGTESQFEAFLSGYTQALYWSTSDELDGESVNLDEFEPSDQADAECLADCRAFFEANYADLCDAADSPGYSWDHAGHDFALTRNHHGAGYWDGDLPDELGERLTKAAQEVGECWAYLGDDKLIHIG